jgi:hypothetical protein
MLGHHPLSNGVKMHFIIGLFLLCVILAVPALRAVALFLFVFGGLVIGGLFLVLQHDNAKITAQKQVSIFDPPVKHCQYGSQYFDKPQPHYECLLP